MNVFRNFLIGKEMGPVAIFASVDVILHSKCPPLCAVMWNLESYSFRVCFSARHIDQVEVRYLILNCGLLSNHALIEGVITNHWKLKKNMWKYILCFAFVLDLKVCLHLIYLLGCEFFCNLLRLYSWVVNYHLKLS